ncbi:hypothetical protein [Hamadaea tsunoensis]|uniref:hypothetical protein n=1 Tax=Hamadaea tsunoensis TaxID=53368 RepID=UPI0004169DF1|nr:hypothetical protein [Hamadaea tsunoensis]
MSDDVLEWGDEPTARRRPSLVIPPVAPYIAAGAGLLAFLLSLMYPWQTLNVVESGNQDGGFDESLSVWPSSSPIGTGYLVGVLALCGLAAVTVAGSRRARRTAGMSGGAIGLGLVVVLLAVVLTHGRGYLALNIADDRVKIIAATEKGLLFAFAAVVLLAGASVLALVTAPARSHPRVPAEEPDEPEDELELTVTAA